MSEDYATHPEDLERYFSVLTNFPAAAHDFVRMQKKCAKYESEAVVVIDAEGELVCIAPQAIAERIAELLNADKRIR